MSEFKLEEQEVREGAPFAALAYLCLWILAFIFRKDNKFAHFHARQGIVIFVGWVVLVAVSWIPFFGRFIYSVGALLLSCASIYGIYLSLTGKMKPLPVIGEIARKLVV